MGDDVEALLDGKGEVGGGVAGQGTEEGQRTRELRDVDGGRGGGGVRVWV